MSVRLPVGCQVKANRVGDKTTAQIIPGDGTGKNTTWMLNIQTPQTSNENATIFHAVEETISLIKGSYGIVDPDHKNFLDDLTQATILDRTDTLILPGGPAARFYVSTPRGDKTRLVKGYTIFKPQSRQYVVFEFVCFEVDFAKQRGIYETIVGTAVFDKADAAMQARGEAIKAGVALIHALTEKDYADALNDKEAWCRLYKPGKTGAKIDDEEMGYRGVRIWRGKRGEINTNKPRSSWTKADEQEGLVAQNRSRVLWNGEVIDTMALYFMTPDRNEECWTIATSIKRMDSSNPRTVTETGARLSDAMQIVKTALKGGSTTLHPPIMGEGSISQLETILLPRLIVKHKTAGEFGFYCWQDHVGVDTGTISFRKDVLAAQGKLFTLSTTLRDDPTPQISVYSENGDLIRTELPGNLVWEPMEPAALKRLWQQKNLPVDH
jgi:hypothetical protein